MPFYVMLTRLTDQGARTVKQHPEHIMEVNDQLGEMGVKVIHQYAVLGQYDFVNVLEAPDSETIARASLELGSRGSIRIETLAAMPVEQLVGTLKK